MRPTPCVNCGELPEVFTDDRDRVYPARAIHASPVCPFRYLAEQRTEADAVAKWNAWNLRRRDLPEVRP